VGPATDTVVAESEVMVTSEVVAAQPPLAEVIVHLSIVVAPIVNPVTPDVVLFTDEANPVPENVDQVPVSVGLGVLDAKVAVVTLHNA
jgi:hypothetical protein